MAWMLRTCAVSRHRTPWTAAQMWCLCGGRSECRIVFGDATRSYSFAPFWPLQKHAPVDMLLSPLKTHRSWLPRTEPQCVSVVEEPGKLQCHVARPCTASEPLPAQQVRPPYDGPLLSMRITTTKGRYRPGSTNRLGLHFRALLTGHDTRLFLYREGFDRLAEVSA